MGILTDVYCLQTSDPASVLAGDVEVPVFQAKGISIVELAQLGELLGVGEGVALSGQFDLIASADDEGPWLLTLPAPLLSAIEAGPDAVLADICAKWATIEEFGNGADPAALRDYLTGLSAFLKRNSGPFALYVCL